MDQLVLNAKVRKDFGKEATRKLRQEQAMPGIIYGGGEEPTAFSVNAKDFQLLSQHITESTIFTLLLDGEEIDVLLKDYQYDPLKDEFVHVDFVRIVRGQTLRVNVAVRLEGTPEGAREGGILDQPLNEVEIECLPKNLPAEFVLDVSELAVGDVLRVEDLKVAEGIEILTDASRTLATVVAPQAEEVAEDAEDAGEEVEEAASEEETAEEA